MLGNTSDSNKNKVITVFISNLYGGGAERVAVNLANQFVKKGFEVHIVLIKKVGNYIEFLLPEIKIFDLNCNRGMYAIIPFAKYIIKNKPSVVLSLLTIPNIIAIIANLVILKRIRLVISERVFYSEVVFIKNSKLRDMIIKKIFTKIFYPFANEIIAVSEDAAQDLEKYGGYKKGRVTCIYNPTITSKLFDLAKHGVDHKWFDEGVPVILAVGRLNYQKNFPLLIEAFAEVRKNIKSKLLILGEGEQRNKLQELINQLKITEDVDLAGFQKNPYAFMSKANLFVCSSDFEGLPNSLIEALACGTPVISTDCKSGPREILDNGKYGVLVPVGDKDKLAGAIVECLKSLEHYKRMSADFQKNVMNKFTQEYATERYLETLFRD